MNRNSEGVENTSGIPKERGVKESGIPNAWGGGWSILEFPNAWGGGKISMPPVVGVRIFSGATHFQVLSWGYGGGGYRVVCCLSLKTLTPFQT